MADLPKQKTPDYSTYTKSVASDVSARNAQNLKYAKRGANAQLDFTNTYKTPRDAPSWISESGAKDPTPAELARYNKSALANRAGWAGEAKNRAAFAKSYDSGDTGIPQFKHGGRVKRTGLAKVHRGERVLTRKQAQSYRKSSGGLRKGH